MHYWCNCTESCFNCFFFVCNKTIYLVVIAGLKNLSNKVFSAIYIVMVLDFVVIA